ncbi:MAG TPA: thiamine pyrophosphate-binding protein [Candidatus Dormibacteraeota bacterium]|jgi:thiamine pyrophosphate-dependent acetolactate synthase large subunit-like protein|nr:thiamine pyrophosphate-binding protein [Candidatus Dormibacteraeota bacterium]
MNVADAVGEALAGLGVEHVFGVIGSGNFTVSNALVRSGATFVASRHECGAVSMADAYARVSGRVGVASVHQGPGLTNAMTALTEAAKSRTPLLLLAADTAASALRSNFKIDQDGLVAAVGAVPERLHGPATAVADAVRAYRRAIDERRTVVLMLPLDVQAAECRVTAPPPAPPRLRPVRPSAESVAEVADALVGARRPLVIAGRGAALAGTSEALERLGERVGALLATSAAANGLFSGNSWSLGISGGFASPQAAALIVQSDVVLAVGAALNMWTTRHGRLLGDGATVIQVDHRADAIGADHWVDIGVVGDAAETASALLEELERRKHRSTGRRTRETAERIHQGAWAGVSYPDAGGEGRIDPRTLSIELDRMLPEDRTVAIDSGHFMGWPAMYMQVPDQAGFVFTQAFQSIGLGLGSAIGAAVARPDRLTVAALGDGGALMSLPELETAARLGLRILIVVYDDASYAAEVHHFRPQGQPLDLVHFPDTDLAALGRAAGLEGLTVRRPEDLAAVGPWLDGEGRPGMLVDAKVVPSVVAEWLEEAFRGH